jgi:hypothetical protein
MADLLRLAQSAPPMLQGIGKDKDNDDDNDDDKDDEKDDDKDDEKDDDKDTIGCDGLSLHDEVLDALESADIEAAPLDHLHKNDYDDDNSCSSNSQSACRKPIV